VIREILTSETLAVAAMLVIFLAVVLV